MSDVTQKPRREFRNIEFDKITRVYKLPLPAILSILHRVSGVLIFLSLPILIHLFRNSLAGPVMFNSLATGFSGFLIRVVCIVALWGFMHHLCAGIRFLILDLHIGMDKVSANKSAKIVFIVSLALTVIFAIKLFGVL